MLPTDPVQMWLDRYRAGERPSLDDLSKLCENRVRQLVRPRLRTFPLVAQDSQTTAVVNDTLLRLIAALEKDVCPPSVLELEQFLAQIIRRVLLDESKSIQRRRRRVGKLGDEPVPEPDDDPVDTETMIAFHEYVEGLPADERALFDVFYYQGKTKEEAARVLGIPPTTAHARWVKARFRLKERFGRDLTQ